LQPGEDIYIYIYIYIAFNAVRFGANKLRDFRKFEGRELKEKAKFFFKFLRDMNNMPKE
jgi:hypothetical protein